MGDFDKFVDWCDGTRDVGKKARRALDFAFWCPIGVDGKPKLEEAKGLYFLRECILTG